MIEKLQEFGLSEKEAQVYVASLELGPATADQIAKQANVKRPTTYVQIESLQNMGLMSSYEEGKKTYFAPESPENIERLLEREKKDLELKHSELLKQLPELQSLFAGAGERPVVRFYQGKEGIKTMRFNALNNLNKGKTLNVMYSYDLLFSLFKEGELGSFSEQRESKGIKLRVIYTRKEGKLPLSSLGKNTMRRFVDPKTFTLKADMFVYGNTVALMALEGSVFGIEIQSKAISESHLSMFELIWQIAESE